MKSIFARADDLTSYPLRILEKKKEKKKKRINRAKKESTEILYRQVFPFESLDESFRS